MVSHECTQLFVFYIEKDAMFLYSVEISAIVSFCDVTALLRTTMGVLRITK